MSIDTNIVIILLNFLSHVNNDARYCLARAEMRPCSVKGWSALSYIINKLTFRLINCLILISGQTFKKYWKTFSIRSCEEFVNQVLLSDLKSCEYFSGKRYLCSVRVHRFLSSVENLKINKRK